MVTIQQHLDRCRQDRTSLYTTLGLGFWGGLALVGLLATAMAAVWP